MSRVVTVGQLAKFDLLRNCSTEELAHLLAASDEVIIQPGDKLLTAGQVERALWLLIMGHAHVTLEIPGHENKQVAQIGPGAVVGEMSFCREAPHSASITGDSACTFIRIDRVRFDALAGEHPVLAAKVTLNVAELLAARLQATDTWICEWLASAEDSRLRDKAVQLRQSFAMRSEATNVFLGLQWH